jgi:hypothetical protein
MHYMLKKYNSHIYMTINNKTIHIKYHFNIYRHMGKILFDINKTILKYVKLKK